MLWSLLGFLSSIIGLLCFALSSSFKHLFGDWNRLKLLLYIIASLITCNIVLFAKKIQVSRSFMVKSHVGFLVFMLTSLFSYFFDKSMNGKPDAMSIISYAAFASMSLCFSRKMELGFEVGLFNFFLGFLAVQLMKISLVLAFVAAVFCYSLIVFRCYMDSQLEIGNGGNGDEEDSVKIVIDAVNGVEPEIAAQSEGINEEVPKLEIRNRAPVDEEDNVDSVIDTAATQNKSVHEEASSASSVGGEKDYEENKQNMKEERVLLNEMQSFPSQIGSFNPNGDTGLRRRNKGKEEDWKCSSCNAGNSGRSVLCELCGQFKSGYNINDLFREAQTRWLKPAEVMFILQNHEQYTITQKPVRQPTSGSLFLFNKRVLRFFRRDGHNWRKKRDGKTVGEAHERLKVGNVEALNCYYAHGEQNPTFQRRSYWMLDPAYEHIVLVHYRETSEGRSKSGPVTQLSSGTSPTFNQSPSSYIAQKLGSTSMLGDSYEPNQSFSNPVSVEVTSDIGIENNGIYHLDGIDAKSGNTTELEVTQALRRVEEQLSMNDNCFKEIDSFWSEQENTHDSNPQHNEMAIHKQDVTAACPALSDHGRSYDGYSGRQESEG